ncbi:ATP-binding protein [Duganella vulcania]|uniref:ATP-binding protein n=1 Tax=Duganella vulcania TaxID=2692166 RepID=A0A845GGH6_9BURK|nr:ATP-binding protein [Duganella vulcania]MYM92346.1 ATP-binding protein [Duganella vulcania]
MTAIIRAKERDTIIQALRAGVVPKLGQQHIQVGRSQELAAQIRDIERIADGGSSFRLIVGDYGSGKSFFLNLVRAIALERKLVTMHADLTPTRRLHGANGQARSLYCELVNNMATRTKNDGGALHGVIEKFIAQAIEDGKAAGKDASAAILARLEPLLDMPNGYDFASVINAYGRGFQNDDGQLQQNALRWLRGEYATKTDARQALGVRNHIDDSALYDQLKLLARFLRIAGYGGLMVGLDEAVNLYKIANAQARNTNYEEILRLLNDCLQGSAEGLGFIIGGTTEFVTDTRRGLYSYQALQSRLAGNTFATGGLIDYTGPMLKLTNLTQEDFYVLLRNIRHVYAGGDSNTYLVPDDGIAAFMQHCAARIGDAYYRTPRTTVTSFINLLAVLEQNPGASWQTLLGRVEVHKDSGAEAEQLADGDDALAHFQM